MGDIGCEDNFNIILSTFFSSSIRGVQFICGKQICIDDDGVRQSKPEPNFVSQNIKLPFSKHLLRRSHVFRRLRSGEERQVGGVCPGSEVGTAGSDVSGRSTN